MKASDVDIIMVSGLGDPDDAHWQSRWQARLSSARLLVQDNWHEPEREAWADRVAETVNAATRPVVLVAHSFGIPAVVNAIPKFTADVRGALFVAPPDLRNRKLKPKSLKAFGPYPRDPLPFPSITIASRTDPHSDFAVAEDIAAAWGSLFIDAGEAGHIDAKSGYGPWPEGSLTLAKLLSRL